MMTEKSKENYLQAELWCQTHKAYQILRLRNALCAYCTYAIQFSSTDEDAHFCNYMSKEHKMRPCLPEECIDAGCFKCVSGKEKAWKKSYDKYKENLL